MVAAAEAMRPIEAASVVFARSVAAWFTGQLETLEHALDRGDHELANLIAANIFGCEKLARVRRAMAVELESIAVTWPEIERRWATLRKNCSFPEPRAVSAAMKAVAQPPSENTKE